MSNEKKVNEFTNEELKAQVNDPSTRSKILDKINDGGTSPWIWDLTESNGTISAQITDFEVNNNRNTDGYHIVGITSKGKSLIPKSVLTAFLEKKDGAKVYADFRVQTRSEFTNSFVALLKKEEKTDTEQRVISRGLDAFRENIGLPTCIGETKTDNDDGNTVETIEEKPAKA